MSRGRSSDAHAAGDAGWAAWDAEEARAPRRRSGPPKVVIQPAEGQPPDAAWASFAADVPRGSLSSPPISRGGPGFALYMRLVHLLLVHLSHCAPSCTLELAVLWTK